MICRWRLNRERVLGSWPGRGHLPGSPGRHLPASASSEPRVHGETEEGGGKQSGPKGLWSLTLSPVTSRPWKAGFFSGRWSSLLPHLPGAWGTLPPLCPCSWRDRSPAALDSLWSQPWAWASLTPICGGRALVSATPRGRTCLPPHSEQVRGGLVQAP